LFLGVFEVRVEDVCRVGVKAGREDFDAFPFGDETLRAVVVGEGDGSAGGFDLARDLRGLDAVAGACSCEV
jgi:hypothetical protein